MDDEDFFTSRPSDPLSLLVKQDLGPISLAELTDRIDVLKGEIARVEGHISATQEHLSAADALFKR